MDKHNNCLYYHTKLVTAVVVAVFLLLGAGEFYLYRQIMYLNRMVSEGFMQIKTEGSPSAQPKTQETPIAPPGGMGLPK